MVPSNQVRLTIFDFIASFKPTVPLRLFRNCYAHSLVIERGIFCEVLDSKQNRFFVQ